MKQEQEPEHNQEQEHNQEREHEQAEEQEQKEAYLIPDSRIAVPEILNESRGDAKLNIRNKECHGDWAGPPAGVGD